MLLSEEIRSTIKLSKIKTVTALKTVRNVFLWYYNLISRAEI